MNSFTEMKSNSVKVQFSFMASSIRVLYINIGLSSRTTNVFVLRNASSSSLEGKYSRDMALPKTAIPTRIGIILFIILFSYMLHDKFINKLIIVQVNTK